MDAAYIWHDSEDTMHPFAIMGRTMDLDHDATGQIHLFADSRYRLWVNGTIVGYGPARFHPDYPEYDSYDISDQLKAGPNVIQVEVWNVQEKNFQMQASRPGFIAWGNAGQVDLSTSSNWRAIKSKARSVSAPRYSFAIPKTEILDQRILDAELAAVVDWPPAVAIDQSHWGELRPRSVPISRFQSRALNQCKVGVIAKPENRYRFHYDFQYSDKKNPMIAIATTLISLKDQDVELALFWGKNFLNGTELELIDDPILGNRQSVSVSLNRGANLLYSEIDACGKSWGHQLGVPAEANVTVQGLPGMEHAFMVSPIISSSEAPSLVAKVPATVEDVDVNFYTPFNEGLDTQFPTRVIAWDTPRDGLTDADITGLQLPMDATGKTVVIIDTMETFTGHPYIELHCEADTIFDISYDEVLRPDGLLNLYSHHLVNSTDRYFIEAGCRRIETLPERGGRYLQLNIESSAPVRLSQVGIRYSTRIPVMVSPLLAPDQFDQKVIDLCKRTLLAGYNECFTDSPWREQGMYLGDHYVQYLAMRSFCADESVIERSLRTFAYCQHPNGQIPAVCPGHYNRQHEDFSLIWIILLGETWTRSGNNALVEELWPYLEAILASDHFHRNGELVGGDHVFIDWGVLPPARGNGGVSAALSAFYAGALQAAEKMAVGIGKSRRSEELRYKRQQLMVEFHTMFWNENLGAYSVSNGEDRNVFSCHTNILALLYNLVPDDYVQSTLFRVKDHLKKQMDTVDSAEEWGGHVELYFTVYAFRMLAQHNSHDLIETIIKKLFGLMIDRHEPNLWECYCLGLNKLGSQCHGWGATPLIYFTEEYLGVSYPDPGNPNKILIRPASATKQSINGVYPHVKGDIFINWRVDDTDFYLSVTAPTGIDIELDAGAMFADHTHHFELNSQVLTARLVPC